MFNQATALSPVELKSAIIRNPLIVSPDTTVMAAIAQMNRLRSSCQISTKSLTWHASQAGQGQLSDLDQQARSSCVLVADKGQLVGILTEQDVVRLGAQQTSLDSLVMQQVMTYPVINLHEPTFTDLFFAINLLQQHNISHLPIVDGHNQVVGMVTDESLQKASRPVDLLRLCLTNDVMTREVICAAPDSSMLTIAQLMADHCVEAVVLVEPDQSAINPLQIPVGILTERDLTQFQALALDLESYQAERVMNTPVITVTPEESLWAVQQTMEKRATRQLVVTGEHGELIGIITQAGLLETLDPVYLYSLTKELRKKVVRLEAEKLALLENRTAELEQQVEARTAALKAKAEREKLILDLATQIRASLSLTPILEITVAQVHQLLGCDRVNIWQFESDGQCVAIAESTGSSVSLMGQHIKGMSLKDGTDVYQQGYIRVISDIDQAKLPNAHRELLNHLQIRAEIVVPLLRGEQLWGFLSVTEQHVRHWQPEDVELMQALSMQLAIALQQAITHQQLQAELNERRQAEQLLRESENRYASLTETAPVGIFRTSSSGHCTYVNDRYCQITGLSPESILETGWQQGLYADDVVAVITAWDQAIQGNRSFQLEYRFQHPDGRVIWVYGQSIAEWNSQGELIGYIGTITDISDRKQTELALQHSEAQSRAILAAIPDFMFRIGVDGVCRGFVTQHRELDVVPQDINYAGRAMVDVLPPDMVARHNHYLQKALQTGELQVYEQSIQVGDRTQEEEVRVIKSGKDEALFMVRDISERRKLEAEREQAEQQLQQLNQALEAKVAERTAALQERETRYRALMDGASDAIVVADLRGNVLEVNRKAEALFGYSRQQFVEINQSQLCPPEDLGRFNAAFTEVVQGRRAQMPFARIMRQDGQIRPIDITATRVTIGDTSIIQGIFRDITERIQSETALRESRQFLQTVLDSFPISVFWKDRNSVYLGCNQAFAKATGLESSADIIGKTDQAFPWLDNDIAQAYETEDQQVITSGTAKLGIIEPQSQANGTQIWIEANKVPIHDLEGNIVGVLGTYQDITARRQAEQTIRQQAEQERLLREITQRIRRQSLDLQTIFDTACQEIRLMIQSDRVGIFKFYPDSDFDEGEFVAESVVDGFSSVVSKRVHTPGLGINYASLYANGDFYVIDDIYNNDLTHCHIDALAAFQIRANLVMPLLCGDQVWGLLCIHQCANSRHWEQSDINFTKQLANQLAIAIQQSSLFEQLQQELSERQQAQTLLTKRNQQLAVSNEELARATRLKDEFLANMSHELRTPLNAILGMAEGLQEEVFGEISTDQMKALKTIVRSGSHLLELINDILDVAKIESGQMELDITTVAIDTLCQTSLTFVKQQALKKRIQLEIKLPPQLPEFWPELWVDERRIRQVLINLLNNAVKFTPEGGRITLQVSHHKKSLTAPPLQGITRVKVYQTARAENLALDTSAKQLADEDRDYLRISVIDTGIGIAPEHIKKLFQPFVQIDSALNRQYTGTGLGLSLVKRIVELHHGSVDLTSELGVGSCFTIDLPCRSATSSPPEPQTPPEPDNAPSHPSPSKVLPLILLAEDNEANISTISSYLKAKGYRLLSAKNGHEAITLAQHENPDLILMDIQMPGMDGLEATRQIRLNPNVAEVPIIALTALAMTGDRDRCLAAGANDYLSKPIKLKQLVTTIQKLLSPQPS